MDEKETPSKRITRGSIAKSQINQQEGMSKFGNTPLKMKEVMHVAKSKGKTKKLDKHKEDKSVDVLTSKKKRKVKEIAFTSNKQDKSVDVLISKKKRKGKDIASTSNKENAQSDSVEQLNFGRIEGVQFILKEDPLYTPHMQCYTNIGVMDQLRSTLPQVASINFVNHLVLLKYQACIVIMACHAMICSAVVELWHAQKSS
ncbi:hypothetical protein KY290_018023 [Solanum tuberosum]|uniref:Uncharacterized protein n=1 Tax=Solanum tuberosum TaxID=4113 RepID=A0ABQ7VFW4_SOLTU|nr:hypothetical protein KY285_018706 [Solanum tuberosum]KAH0761950.1 hypothetical protein KY290_018023 [Solanum tuberosum]